MLCPKSQNLKLGYTYFQARYMQLRTNDTYCIPASLGGSCGKPNIFLYAPCQPMVALRLESPAMKCPQAKSPAKNTGISNILSVPPTSC